MYGRNEPSDDMCYCEYCGQHYYPEVGPPGHLCSAKLEELERGNEALRKKEIGIKSMPRRKVRIVIDIECYNSDLHENGAIDRCITELQIYKKPITILRDQFGGFAARISRQKI